MLPHANPARWTAHPLMQHALGSVTSLLSRPLMHSSVHHRAIHSKCRFLSADSSSSSSSSSQPAFTSAPFCPPTSGPSSSSSSPPSPPKPMSPLSPPPPKPRQRRPNFIVLQSRHIRAGDGRDGESEEGYPKQVKIVEVGPRDGLQNEKVTLPTGSTHLHFSYCDVFLCHTVKHTHNCACA